jgi:hypothetical protein
MDGTLHTLFPGGKPVHVPIATKCQLVLDRRLWGRDSIHPTTRGHLGGHLLVHFDGTNVTDAGRATVALESNRALVAEGVPAFQQTVRLVSGVILVEMGAHTAVRTVCVDSTGVSADFRGFHELSFFCLLFLRFFVTCQK